MLYLQDSSLLVTKLGQYVFKIKIKFKVFGSTRDEYF